MQIRRIKENEIRFLNEMLYEAIFVENGKPKLPKSIIKDPSLSRYIENFGADSFDICLVAVQNGKLIGASWGRLFSAKNKGYGFLDRETPEIGVALKKRFRNKGFGTKLILELIHMYSELNVKSVSLSIDKKNLAIELYYKLGFKVIEQTKKSVVMRLEVKPK